MFKILLVEAQPSAAAELAQGLAGAGIAVDTERDGADGLRRLLTGAYQLAIVDVDLPTLGGWTILTQARRADMATPVLLMDAGADASVRALALGADEYLPKAVAYAELLARVRVILRRQSRLAATDAGAAPRYVVLADLQVDLARGTVMRGSDNIALTPNEFKLLMALLRHPGEVIPPRRLMTQVWRMHADAKTNVVPVAIQRLRGKIDAPYSAKLLHTVRGVGYRIGTGP